MHNKLKIECPRTYWIALLFHHCYSMSLPGIGTGVVGWNRKCWVTSVCNLSRRYCWTQRSMCYGSLSCNYFESQHKRHSLEHYRRTCIISRGSSCPGHKPVKGAEFAPIILGMFKLCCYSKVLTYTNPSRQRRTLVYRKLSFERIRASTRVWWWHNTHWTLCAIQIQRHTQWYRLPTWTPKITAWVLGWFAPLWIRKRCP